MTWLEKFEVGTLACVALLIYGRLWWEVIVDMLMEDDE